MAGKEEARLRGLIAGARLDAAIDGELSEWLNAKKKLREVGEALIAVSTPVSENLPEQTVTSALEAFKAVGEKVSDRADDIEAIHSALQHAVTVTRNAQTAVQEMDGDQRDKPEFPPSKPGDDETDEMHDLKVYSGQMNLYNSWSTARETQSQQHADKVETAWKDAIAVMEKVPDDQTGGGGPGGGGGTGTGPIIPTRHHADDPHDDADDAGRRRLDAGDHHRSPAPHPDADPDTDAHADARPDSHADPAHPDADAGPAGREPRAGDAVPPEPPRRTGPVPGRHALRPRRSLCPPVGWRRRRPSRPARSAAWPSVAWPVRASSAASERGCARPAWPARSGGLRSGGVLGASGRTAGSARGTLGTAGGRGTMAGGAASGGTGRGGSRGSAGRRGAGGVGAGGAGRGKDKDKKKRKPATVELFDEDRDWIDDEGASSGVID